MRWDEPPIGWLLSYALLNSGNFSNSVGMIPLKIFIDKDASLQSRKLKPIYSWIDCLHTQNIEDEQYDGILGEKKGQGISEKN